ALSVALGPGGPFRHEFGRTTVTWPSAPARPRTLWRWNGSASRVGFLTGPVPAAELAAMVEEGRPATASLLDERLDPLRSARVGAALQKLGYEPRPGVLGLTGEDLGPIHLGGLELLGPRIMPQRRLADPVQVGGEPRVDLRVVEPGPHLGMDLG